MLQVVREHQFGRLCKVVGHEEWLHDARLATRRGWSEHLELILRPAIEDWARTTTKLQAAEALCAQCLAAAPSYEPEEVLADPHLRDRHMLVEVRRPDGDEPFVVVGNPIRFVNGPERPLERWPRLGEHTNDILRAELGMSDEDLAVLRGRGVI